MNMISASKGSRSPAKPQDKETASEMDTAVNKIVTHKCIKMANKHIEVFTLLVIRKMQIQTTKRRHCTPTGTAKTEKTDNPILVKL